MHLQMCRFRGDTHTSPGSGSGSYQTRQHRLPSELCPAPGLQGAEAALGHPACSRPTARRTAPCPGTPHSATLEGPPSLRLTRRHLAKGPPPRASPTRLGWDFRSRLPTLQHRRRVPRPRARLPAHSRRLRIYPNPSDQEGLHASQRPQRAPGPQAGQAGPRRGQRGPGLPPRLPPGLQLSFVLCRCRCHLRTPRGKSSRRSAEGRLRPQPRPRRQPQPSGDPSADSATTAHPSCRELALGMLPSD